MPDNRDEYEIINKVVSIVNMIHKWHLINIYDNFYVYKSEKRDVLYTN
jgi:hypothetical protein